MYNYPVYFLHRQWSNILYTKTQLTNNQILFVLSEIFLFFMVPYFLMSKSFAATLSCTPFLYPSNSMIQDLTSFHLFVRALKRQKLVILFILRCFNIHLLFSDDKPVLLNGNKIIICWLKFTYLIFPMKNHNHMIIVTAEKTVLYNQNPLFNNKDP